MSTNDHLFVKLEDGGKSSIQRESIITDLDTNRFEYVMTFPAGRKDSLEKIVALLKEARLQVEQALSRDEDEYFVFITASVDLFEETAQRLRLKKPLKERCGGGRSEFNPKRKGMFKGYKHEIIYWTSYERNQMIYNLIQGSAIIGGANLDIAKLISDGEVNSCFPLHNVPQKERLMQYWVRRSWKTWAQPIDMIREYFGEYITLYFAWLGHYSKWLIIPSIIGTIVFIIGLGLRNFDNFTVPVYCLFIMLWGTFYVEFWKRRNSELVTEWDATDFVAQERVRPSFKGEKRYGVYIRGDFISLDPEKTPNAPQSDWAPTAPRYWKFGFGLSMLTTFLGMVVVGTLGIFVFRQVMNKLTPTFGPIVAGIVNAVMIIIFNMLYRRVATILTNWENHRTESEYENSFIVKTFLFQFVNSYVSLFYIAFFKETFALFGNESYRQQCKPNCMTELTIQLGTILLTNIFVGQANEVLLPWLSGKLFVWYEGKRLLQKNIARDASQAEVESKLWRYENAFDDYNEMAIQFGYVTLFAAAFPLAPLAALLNNFVEMRTDALKLIMGMQRPHPRGADSIGNWLDILEIISYLSVASNCGLIFFTSTEIEHYFGVHWSWYTKLWLAIIVEHLLFVGKFLISRIIPDTPKWVREVAARREYLKEAAEQEFIEAELEKANKEEQESETQEDKPH